MKYFPFLLAYRTVTRRESSPIRVMMKLCGLSIFVACASLVLMCAIMDGFTLQTIKKLQGVHDDIVISSHGKELNTHALEKTVKKNLTQEIDSYHPRGVQHGLIITQNGESHVILVTGIDTSSATLEKLQQALQLSSECIEKIKEPSMIFIGKPLQENLHLKPLEPLSLAAPADTGITGNALYFNKKKCILAGSYTSGIEDFDMHVAFCSLETFCDLYETGVTELGISLRKDVSLEETVFSLRFIIGPELDIATWKDLYPALVDALKLQTYALIFIFGLIILMASMCISALLYMLIHQKRPEIAVMQTQGISMATIQKSYLLMSCSLTLLSSLLGVAFGSLSAWLINHYRLIPIGDMYAVSHLPAHLSWHIIGTILIASFLLGIIASSIALKSIKKIPLLTILRFET